MTTSQFQTKTISFSIDICDDDQIQDFTFQQLTDDQDEKKCGYNETVEILDNIKGMYLHNVSKALALQSSLFNQSLLSISRFLLSLQGKVNLSEFDSKKLICRCFGLSKEQVLENYNQDQLAGSACGTCRSEVINLLPGDTFLSLENEQGIKFLPIDFHIKAFHIIKNNSKSDIKAELTRAVGSKLYIDLKMGAQLIDPHLWMSHLKKEIFKDLGIKCEIILNLN